MDCWISTDYQSRTGNMAYPCTNRKTADSYYLNRSYQLDRIAVLLFLRQGTNAAMAGYWSSKILATSESNIWHYKIFCVNGNTGFKFESRIFYFIHLQNEENYERKESSSAR